MTATNKLFLKDSMAARRFVLFLLLTDFILLCFIAASFYLLKRSEKERQPYFNRNRISNQKSLWDETCPNINRSRNHSGFRTAEIWGTIVQITKAKDKNILELDLSEKCGGAKILIDLGPNDNVLGIKYSSREEGIIKNSKNNWNNTKLDEVFEKLEKGKTVSLEVTTWLDENKDCGENEVCLNIIRLYKRNIRGNKSLNQLLFENHTGRGGKYPDLNKLGVVGPAITLNFLAQ